MKLGVYVGWVGGWSLALLSLFVLFSGLYYYVTASFDSFEQTWGAIGCVFGVIGLGIATWKENSIKGRNE